MDIPARWPKRQFSHLGQCSRMSLDATAARSRVDRSEMPLDVRRQLAGQIETLAARTIHGVSHSKTERQPYEERRPKYKKWVVACTSCGRKGRSPSFTPDVMRPRDMTVAGFLTAYDPLALDECGRCSECSVAARRFASSP